MMLLCFHHRACLRHELPDYGYLRNIIAEWWQMNEISLVDPVQMFLCYFLTAKLLLGCLLHYMRREVLVCVRGLKYDWQNPAVRYFTRNQELLWPVWHRLFNQA